MKRKNLRKVITAILTLATIATASTTTAFAANHNVDSIGSETIDATMPTADDMTGRDISQEKTTVYSGEITEDCTEEVLVYATQASTFSVKIPKVVILNGKAGESNTGKYQVSVKGNIAGDETILVTPKNSFSLESTGKAPIPVITSQDYTNFVDCVNASDSVKNGVNPYGYITANGSYTTDGSLSAGQWKGTTDFNIGLSY